MEGALGISKLTQRLKLTISPNSKVVCSNARLSKRISDELRALGIPLEASEAAGDVGSCLGLGRLTTCPF